ncbi:MAG: MazG nucleotide pyrophosphohydrolase domain-containing protein, partial [Longimicrobiales bacterium]
EEVAEVRVAIQSGEAEAVQEEIGDLLFAAVNLARLAGHHPTQALRAANRKFAQRFEALEDLAAQRGVKLGSSTLEELDRLWDEVKILNKK